MPWIAWVKKVLAWDTKNGAGSVGGVGRNFYVSDVGGVGPSNIL